MNRLKHPIRDWARKNGVQNEVIAKALSITKEQTSRILNLKCEPSPMQIYKLANLVFPSDTDEFVLLMGAIVHVHAIPKIIEEADV